MNFEKVKEMSCCSPIPEITPASNASKPITIKETTGNNYKAACEIDYVLKCICEQRKQISMLVETIALYKNAIREICRRSENTYYDWCCDQCACDCDKRNGWCNDFEPVSYGK